jgi:hypothetical protein
MNIAPIHNIVLPLMVVMRIVMGPLSRTRGAFSSR